ncbi:hypothetical protein SAMN05421504_10693 [Amycolatopsis xylanica]|uniref:Uncharacterized protein n=1 Tax=Amycolatopsis xylanica TaxID=589385 RepID=A0A1H3L791_9PSEU|nr:hypothetical protein [Amycolatopsis xylanica]SDY60200.1 hypothetical protein SAMN05421504_10693 [Amycolatopsis xylanica]
MTVNVQLLPGGVPMPNGLPKRYSAKEDKNVHKFVEQELRKVWLQPGEKLLFGQVPTLGFLGARIGQERHVPYRPTRPVPELTLKPVRLRQPTEFVFRDTDWTDEPVLSYWAHAEHPDQIAVRLADHLSDGSGAGRLVWTDRRLAVTVFSKWLVEQPDKKALITTVCDLGPGLVTAISMPFTGMSFPAVRVVRLDFADRSTLLIRDDHAKHKVEMAWQRLGH